VSYVAIFFYLDWMDWFNFDLSSHLSPVWHIKCATIVWHIWCYRIRCVFDKACIITRIVWKHIYRDIAHAFTMQDCLYNTKQRIISWKPPIKSAYKINMDAFQSDDRMFAIGVVVIMDAEFNWFLGITRKIISSCMLEMLLITLWEALVQAWSYQLNMLEVDLGRKVNEELELQAGPLTCRSYLQQVITEARELLSRNWQVTFNYA